MWWTLISVGFKGGIVIQHSAELTRGPDMINENVNIIEAMCSPRERLSIFYGPSLTSGKVYSQLGPAAFYGIPNTLTMEFSFDYDGLKWTHGMRRTP